IGLPNGYMALRHNLNSLADIRYMVQQCRAPEQMEVFQSRWQDYPARLGIPVFWFRLAQHHSMACVKPECYHLSVEESDQPPGVHNHPNQVVSRQLYLHTFLIQ